jgi:hypothetical protein
MWDTPNPPRLDSCRFVPRKGPIPRRVRTVSFDEHVTGITVFCSSGHTYGIYVHRGKLSSAFDTYMKFPKPLRWSFVWLYFPLAPGEAIEDVWIRCRKSRSNTANDGPALVVSILLAHRQSSDDKQMQTSFDRLQTFGHYLAPSNWPGSSYQRHYHLCSRPIDSLLYHDPDPGHPILYFGTSRADCAERESESCPSYSTARYASYRSRASLENVENIQCFYVLGKDSAQDSVPVHFCIGMLLEYSNKRREALGQCKIGTLQSIHAAPARIYMKFEPNSPGLLIQFGSDHPAELGWVVIEMIGEITWWFKQNNAVSISHSGKWVTSLPVNVR